jgi:hypothetical protein
MTPAVSSGLCRPFGAGPASVIKISVFLSVEIAGEYLSPHFFSAWGVTCDSLLSTSANHVRPPAAPCLRRVCSLSHSLLILTFHTQVIRLVLILFIFAQHMGLKNAIFNIITSLKINQAAPLTKISSSLIKGTKYQQEYSISYNPS